MRSLVALLVFLPLPVLADRFEAVAKITHITALTPVGLVTRTAQLTLPAGQHEVLIPELPPDFDLTSLSIEAPDGVQIVSKRVAEQRLPLTEKIVLPQIKAAEDLRDAREADLRDAQREVDLLRLQVEAAQAQIAYLRQIGTSTAPQSAELDIAAPELLRAMGEAIRTEMRAALEAAKHASFAADDAERGLKDKKEALERAELALQALTPARDHDPRTLILGIDAATAGEVELKLTHFVPGVVWAPVYDLYLTRGAEPKLVIQRGVTIRQESGEDWSGVVLTISNATPSHQIEPSPISAQLRRIFEESQVAVSAGAAPAPSARYSEPAVILEEVSSPWPVFDYAGNVTYQFPLPVDLRAGVDHLRLELGSLTLTPELLAAAAPLHDDTAYLLASFSNTSTELLLPGEAVLWLEGQPIGAGELPLLAAGAEVEIGFGPIHGLKLKRITPERSSGSAGLIGRSYQQNEQVQIEVENLTAEAWPLRLTDHVPYSEQDQLRVSWTASPPPTLTDKDGKRGVLEWQFDIDAGAKHQIQLDWRLDWPSGYALQ